MHLLEGGESFALCYPRDHHGHRGMKVSEVLVKMVMAMVMVVFVVVKACAKECVW